MKYKIVDSHLEIIGYDPFELKGDVKPYASVKYLGTTYNTRIILEEAFRNCKTITGINIPNTVTEIGPVAFCGCKSLSDIYIEGKPSARDLGYEYDNMHVPSFSPTTCENATLHVKAENLEWFKSHYGWSRFKNIVGDYNGE